MNAEYREPTVLIPYGGPCGKGTCQDVFVYLRPETNGIEVESTIMRVVTAKPEYRDAIDLVYLANIPGDFIRRNQIVENYNRSQLYFSERGKSGFTPHMKSFFESYFHEDFEKASIVGPFKAMELFSLTYDELFNLRVPVKEMLIINGQSLKHYRGSYILNYDLPAISHKNNNKTDIAAMMFRTNLGYKVIHQVIEEMGKALIEENILHSEKPLSRIFHYSKGPFDQIRDALGHLYTPVNTHVPITDVSFCSYLLGHGAKIEEIFGVIENPIVRFLNNSGVLEEDYIFSITRDDSYETACQKFLSIKSQLWISDRPKNTEII